MPVDTVNRVVPSLVRDGHYEQPSIGIKLDERLNERLEQVTGIEGALVLRVTPDSSAEAAGLQAARLSREGEFIGGDIIVSVNGKKMESVSRSMTSPASPVRSAARDAAKMKVLSYRLADLTRFASSPHR